MFGVDDDLSSTYRRQGLCAFHGTSLGIFGTVSMPGRIERTRGQSILKAFKAASGDVNAHMLLRLPTRTHTHTHTHFGACAVPLHYIQMPTHKNTDTC